MCLHWPYYHYYYYYTCDIYSTEIKINIIIITTIIIIVMNMYVCMCSYRIVCHNFFFLLSFVLYSLQINGIHICYYIWPPLNSGINCCLPFLYPSLYHPLCVCKNIFVRFYSILEFAFCQCVLQCMCSFSYVIINTIPYNYLAVVHIIN